jgi:glycosyltransferase involved in cell wall biosynthesis
VSPAGPFPTVCFFQAYNRDYIRTEALLEGLVRRGVPVVLAKANHRNPLRRYPLAIARCLRALGGADVVLANFRSFEQLWLLRLLTRKPIVYDAHISFWQSACEERGWFGERSLFGRLLFAFDRWNCRLADHVLIDTEAHRDYFMGTFGVPPEKITAVYISCEESLFQPRPEPPREGPPRVFWSGSGIPLQGLPVILGAARVLARRGVSVEVRIAGQSALIDRVAAEARAEGLDNMVFLGQISRSRVIQEVAAAEVGLGGHYSTIPKATQVIAGKVYELLAMARPAVVGGCPATRELFTDGENAVLCEMGSAESLADAIERLLLDPALAARVARGGHDLYQRRLRPEVVVEPLLAVLAGYASGR